MNYRVETIPNFDKEFKRLAKKYPSLKRELSELADSLSINPFQGTPLGSNFYKIRLSVASKGSGKSGGARIITNVKVMRETVYLVSVYDKGDKDTISDKELENLIKEIPG